MKVDNEERADYNAERHIQDDHIIASALSILRNRMKHGDALTTPNAVRDYLRLAITEREHEVFVCVWVDAMHRVIKCEEMFRGTLT